MTKEEAIKIIRDWNLDNNKMEVLSVIIPKLKESEDEKIRKELIKVFEERVQHGFEWKDGIPNNAVIAWLEKQGEQKLTRPVWKYKKDHTPLLRDSFILNKYGCVAKSPSGALVSDVWVLDFDELAKLPKEEFERQNEQKPIDKIEPKFKVGDWIINNDKRIAVPTQILKIEKYGYATSMGYTSFDKVKTDYHLWTIQDANVGDVLYCENHGTEFIVMNKGVNENGNIDSYFRYNSKAGFDIDVSSVLSADGDIISPTTKEQCDFLFQKMHEAGYEWDAEKEELKKIEQKPTWSEEDEKNYQMLQKIICDSDITANLANKLSDWLKSLKDRMKGE